MLAGFGEVDAFPWTRPKLLLSLFLRKRQEFLLTEDSHRHVNSLYEDQVRKLDGLNDFLQKAADCCIGKGSLTEELASSLQEGLLVFISAIEYIKKVFADSEEVNQRGNKVIKKTGQLRLLVALKTANILESQVQMIFTEFLEEQVIAHEEFKNIIGQLMMGAAGSPFVLLIPKFVLNGLKNLPALDRLSYLEIISEDAVGRNILEGVVESLQLLTRIDKNEVCGLYFERVFVFLRKLLRNPMVTSQQVQSLVQMIPVFVGLDKLSVLSCNEVFMLLEELIFESEIEKTGGLIVRESLVKVIGTVMRGALPGKSVAELSSTQRCIIQNVIKYSLKYFETNEIGHSISPVITQLTESMLKFQLVDSKNILTEKDTRFLFLRLLWKYSLIKNSTGIGEFGKLVIEQIVIMNNGEAECDLFESIVLNLRPCGKAFNWTELFSSIPSSLRIKESSFLRLLNSITSIYLKDKSIVIDFDQGETFDTIPEEFFDDIDFASGTSSQVTENSASTEKQNVASFASWLKNNVYSELMKLGLSSDALAIETLARISAFLLENNTIAVTDMTSNFGPGKAPLRPDAWQQRSYLCSLYCWWLRNLELTSSLESKICSVLSPLNLPDVWIRFLLDQKSGDESVDLFFRGYFDKSSLVGYDYRLAVISEFMKLPSRIIVDAITAHVQFESVNAREYWRYIMNLIEGFQKSDQLTIKISVLLGKIEKHFPKDDLDLILLFYRLNEKFVTGPMVIKGYLANYVKNRISAGQLLRYFTENKVSWFHFFTIINELMNEDLNLRHFTCLHSLTVFGAISIETNELFDHRMNALRTVLERLLEWQRFGPIDWIPQFYYRISLLRKLCQLNIPMEINLKKLREFVEQTANQILVSSSVDEFGNEILARLRSLFDDSWFMSCDFDDEHLKSLEFRPTLMPSRLFEIDVCKKPTLSLCFWIALDVLRMQRSDSADIDTLLRMIRKFVSISRGSESHKLREFDYIFADLL